MVSFNVYRSTTSGFYVEGVCLATDEKPVVGIANGSILFAVDTESGETTRYMYDQNSMSWIEAACPCGGGGSGGGGNVVYCSLRSEGPYYYAEKTTRELAQAETIIFEQTVPAEFGGGTFYYPCVNWAIFPEGGSFSFLLPGEGETPRMINIGAAMDDYPTNDESVGGMG